MTTMKLIFLTILLTSLLGSPVWLPLSNLEPPAQTESEPDPVYGGGDGACCTNGWSCCTRPN